MRQQTYKSTTFSEYVSRPRVNPQEAPVGYYAVPKPVWTPDSGNLCRQCDWRKTCQDPKTDFLAFGHRCSDIGVVSVKDGKTYQRQDGCSVLFKKLEG